MSPKTKKSKPRTKQNKKQLIVRIVAIALAVLLAGGAIISVIMEAAGAEELPHDRETMSIEYLENEQALRVTQRLVYTNASGVSLDRVLFYAPANMFRRMDALMYEGDELTAAFPQGYLPGGIALSAVTVDGEPADYGYRDGDMLFLRVACALEPGAHCEFGFEYYVLLTRNSAFLGIGDTDVRLSAFGFMPALYDRDAGDFVLSRPLSFTGYICAPVADWEIDLMLPKAYTPVCGGAKKLIEENGSVKRWSLTIDSLSDIAIAFDSKRRLYDRTMPSGVTLRCLAGDRRHAEKALDRAAEALEFCEANFGACPRSSFTIVETDIVPDALNTGGMLWLSPNTLKGDDMRLEVCAAVARMYFGDTARVYLSDDAWMPDALAEYIYYLVVEDTRGHDDYLRELNTRLVPSLQLTIPGGLHVSSEASLFDAPTYDIVVRKRGAAVMHEMRTSMGREAFLTALRLFYEKGLQGGLLTEMDLLHAMDEADGRSHEAELTDWIFNIGRYAEQSIDWLD